MRQLHDSDSEPGYMAGSGDPDPAYEILGKDTRGRDGSSGLVRKVPTRTRKPANETLPNTCEVCVDCHHQGSNARVVFARQP